MKHLRGMWRKTAALQLDSRDGLTLYTDANYHGHHQRWWIEAWQGGRSIDAAELVVRPGGVGEYYVETIATHSSYRRKGLMTWLFEVALDWYRNPVFIHDGEFMSDDAKKLFDVLHARHPKHHEWSPTSATRTARTASGQVRDLGPSPLDYDAGRPNRVGIIDPGAGPAKPGWTYFTSEPVEEYASRMKRERWDAAPEGQKPSKTKPRPVYVENSGRAQPGLVAFLDWSYAGNSIYIHFMSTRPDQRGRGHSSALLRWVYDKALTEGRSVDWGRVFYDAQRLFDQYRKVHPEITFGKYAARSLQIIEGS